MELEVFKKPPIHQDEARLSEERLDDYIALGRYSIMVLLVAFFSIITQSGNLTYMVYSGLQPHSITCVKENETYDISKCNQFNEIGCKPQLEYDFRSVNVEFNRYCEGDHDVTVSTSIQMIGVLLGSVVTGQISDTYGRKWTMFGSLFATLIFGCGTALAGTLNSFTIFRFLTCFAVGGQVTVIFVLMCELFPSRDRFWITMLLNWSPSLAINAAIAYWAGTWRTYTVVLNMITLIPMVVLLAMYETPHFLLRQRKFDEALKTIQAILIHNQQDYNGEKLIKMIENEKIIANKTESQKYTLLHLFCSRSLITYTLILSGSFLITSLVNYGIIFDVGSLSGSPFVNMALSGGLRYAINIVTALSDRRFDNKAGRRIVHISCALFTLLAILLTVVFKIFDISLEQTERFLLIAAMSVVSQCYVADGVLTNELFPTQIRSIAFSFMQFTSRTGVVLSPFIPLLAHFTKWLPGTTLALLLATNLVFFIPFIPETKMQPLPDHMPPAGERIFSRKTVAPEKSLPH